MYIQFLLCSNPKTMMPTLRRILLACLAGLCISATAETLPRRAFLGTQLLEVCDSLAALGKLPETGGVFVQRVVEGSTAGAMGLEAGDIIWSANGKKPASVDGFVKDIQQLSAGDPIALKAYRNGSLLFLEGQVAGFPAETSPHARVIYDQVPFEDGYARTIIHAPHTEGKHPVFFFVQGYTCVSMDNMGEHSPVRKLLEGISARGYVVVKTEKAGMGDSRSSRNCADINLFDEVGIFEASYNALSKYDFVDLDNVFVFGHSMGGVQAPLMRTDFDPRGMIVFGTVARPWFEYLVEQTRKQRLILGQDYLDNEAGHEQSIRFFYRFLIEKEKPEQLLQDPEMAEFMTRYWNWEGGGLLNGRHYTFWQQLQDTRPFTAWSKVNSYVLSLHGEGEYVAFNPYEHQLIADIVNTYNPGMATFLRVPNTDHAFLYVKDAAHSASIRNDAGYWRHNFNYSLVNLLVNWMEDHRRK